MTSSSWPRGLHLPPDAVPQAGQDPEQPLPEPVLGKDLANCTAITAVIDDAMPLLSARLRRNGAPDKTRVEYAWVQDGVFQPGGSVAYGRQHTATGINQAIQDFSSGRPQLNELAAYRDLGLADFTQDQRHGLAFRRSHGAHVSDLAAGREQDEFDVCGACKDPIDNPVILVQLPKYATEDTSGGSLGPHVLAAIDYIVDRADRIAQARKSARLPLVINFSYGALGGPHDGTHYIERKIEQVTKARRACGAKTAIVLPAGNQNLSQCHARMNKTDHFQGGTETLSWRVQPDDFTSSFVEIWMPKGEAPGTSRLSSPRRTRVIVSQ